MLFYLRQQVILCLDPGLMQTYLGLATQAKTNAGIQVPLCNEEV